jgi:CBS domain-containing protein
MATGPLNSGSSVTFKDNRDINADKYTRAKDIAQYELVAIDKDASVYQAINLMVKHDITGLPVIDGPNLVGIISEKDVLKLLYDTEFLAGSVADYMTMELLTFQEEDDLTDICRGLVENNFRRVPVLRGEKLVAIITRADLIRANKYRFKPKAPHNQTLSQPNFLHAKDVMTFGLRTVRRSTHVYTAMEAIATGNITGLPVVDDSKKLLGIISEKDLLKLLCDPKAKPGLVADFMTRDVVSFDWDDSLFDICHCLINNNFRRVPILEKGLLKGIISRRDIIMYIMENREHFFHLRPKN